MLIPLVSLAAWLLIWLWLFVDCMRSPSLHPLLGSRQRARWLWGLLFLAVNPILVGLYALLGRTRRSAALSSAWRSALVLTGAVVALAMQSGLGTMPALARDVKAEPIEISPSLGIGFTLFEHSFSLTTMTQTGKPLAPRRVRVSYSGDPVSRASATRVARDLANESWTDKVELWPRSNLPDSGARAPDLYVDIATADSLLLPTPLVQHFKGRLLFTASSAPFPMGARTAFDGLPQLGQVEYRGSADYSFTHLGSALGSAGIGDLAEKLAAVFKARVIARFREHAEANGQTEDPPGALIPATVAIPAALEAMGLTSLGREHGPYVHERATFLFDDPRPSMEVLGELSSALAAQGWNETWGRHAAGEMTVMVVDREGVRLTVGRSPRPAWSASVRSINGERVALPPAPVSTSPFVASLQSRFNKSD